MIPGVDTYNDKKEPHEQTCVTDDKGCDEHKIIQKVLWASKWWIGCLFTQDIMRLDTKNIESTDVMNRYINVILSNDKKA